MPSLSGTVIVTVAEFRTSGTLLHWYLQRPHRYERPAGITNKNLL